MKTVLSLAAAAGYLAASLDTLIGMYADYAAFNG